MVDNRALFVASLVLLMFSLFPFWVAQNTWRNLNDDSYITLTYAKNLANGRGFVFNYPPATLGTTSPLFAGIIAILASLLRGIEISYVAVLFSAACWAGISWVILFNRRAFPLDEFQAVTVGISLIAGGAVGFLGMEAYLFAFLLTVAICFLLAERWGLAGLCIALLFLTRGEGSLLLFVSVAFIFYRKSIAARRPLTESISPSIRLVLGSAIPLVIWSAYALHTFGTVLPNTLGAKMAQAQSGYWRTFLSRLIAEWLPSWEPQFALAKWLGLANQPWAFLLSVWWLLVAVGLLGTAFHYRRWGLFFIWCSLYALGYILLGVAGYWWYEAPLLFLAELSMAIGLLALKEVIAAKVGETVRAIGLAAWFVLLAVMVGGLIQSRVDAVRNYTGDPRASSYLSLSQWLRDHTRADQSVAYVEVGYLGYWTDNRIFDLVGLILPASIPHIAKGDFAWAFWQNEPDYYIYLSDFDWLSGQIRSDPRFNQMYQPVQVLPGPRQANFVIYARSSNR